MVRLRNLLQAAAFFGLGAVNTAAFPWHTGGHNISTTTIWEFPNGTWVENLAVRSNGRILTTVIHPQPTLWQIDPFTDRADNRATAIHTWPDKTALTGIVEIEPDVFAVVAGNLSVIPTFAVTPGSFEVWRVDLREGLDKLFVELIAQIPEAYAPNGMTALKLDDDADDGKKEKDRTLLLIADSVLAAVWSVDAQSGESAKLLADSSMAPPANSSGLGINGLHAFGRYLYFDNASRKTFNRVAIDRTSGRPAGPYEIVANLTAEPDDFALDRRGDAYVAGSNRLTRVSRDGRNVSVVTDAPAILGSTSAAWGRTPIDASTLYVTTSGGILQEDVTVHGGRVVAVPFGSSP